MIAVLVVSWIIVSVPGEASGSVLISYVRGDVVVSAGCSMRLRRRM